MEDILNTAPALVIGRISWDALNGVRSKDDGPISTPNITPLLFALVGDGSSVDF